MVMLLYAGVASVFFGKCPLWTTPAHTHTHAHTRRYTQTQTQTHTHTHMHTHTNTHTYIHTQTHTHANTHTHEQHPHTHHVLFILKLDMSPSFVLTLVLMPIALLSLISAIGGGQLYCSSEDLIQTMANPTAYCVFQGHLGECNLLVLLSFVFYCIAHQGNSLALELKLKEQRPCIWGIRSVYVLWSFDCTHALMVFCAWCGVSVIKRTKHSMGTNRLCRLWRGTCIACLPTAAAYM